MKNRLSPYYIGSLIVVVALLIVTASVLYTNHLAAQLRQEEQQRIELWADATKRIIQAKDTEDLSFYLTIIEANTTIPVYMLDNEGAILDTRNVTKPVSDPKELNGPIELRISDDIIQYIYYDESTLLTQLKLFPYIEFGIILLFIIIAVVTLYTAQRSEQDRVWAGLSKETAHQLGTPISSLNAWMALLEDKGIDDNMLESMQLDIDRLNTIAERFSKIGSAPELKPTLLTDIVTQTINYMRTRISNKVTIEQQGLNDDAVVQLNAPLFSWVLENLIKNALDAMNGKGTITITMGHDEENICLDITDTGRGIDHNHYKTIFQPGYTSKKRGWGLGLSLAKRIIEDYHRGKIFVKSSEIGVGTTFRILLKQSKNS
ncbi:MAG: HAMP domain-containing histidine kinase [Paludibacteraceae bacterium]|nr:HAMP domain-containing histidine kinase [Paludibacteraceae bacterium]